MSQPVNEIVREVAALPANRRQALLQRLIGDQVPLDHPDLKRTLHNRALLITRLNQRGVWPPR